MTTYRFTPLNPIACSDNIPPVMAPWVGIGFGEQDLVERKWIVTEVFARQNPLRL